MFKLHEKLVKNNPRVEQVRPGRYRLIASNEVVVPTEGGNEMIFHPVDSGSFDGI
jgi:hypothetical protein